MCVGVWVGVCVCVCGVYLTLSYVLLMLVLNQLSHAASVSQGGLGAGVGVGAWVGAGVGALEGTQGLTGAVRHLTPTHTLLIMFHKGSGVMVLLSVHAAATARQRAMAPVVQVHLHGNPGGRLAVIG